MLFTNFYPRPPRGGRLLGVVHVFAKIGISIHALREEGDVLSHCPLADLAISIHALREEGDTRAAATGSTEPISIHALREEGDRVGSMASVMAVLFLSTPSARRATTSPSPASLQICYFYPRPPRGGRLPHTDGSRDASMISIHALREEGDATGAYCRAKADDFYPRPPRGGRPPKNRFG